MFLMSHLEFPIRYYIIDFEFAVKFAPDSKPDERTVSGLPVLKRGVDHPDDYGRDLAPEMVTQESYDPFKADVFQLGAMFYDKFYVRERGAFFGHSPLTCDS